MSFIESSTIQCPFLGGSTIGGFTVYTCSVLLVYMYSCRLHLMREDMGQNWQKLQWNIQLVRLKERNWNLRSVSSSTTVQIMLKFHLSRLVNLKQNSVKHTTIMLKLKKELLW